MYAFLSLSNTSLDLPITQGSYGTMARPKEVGLWIKYNRQFDKPPPYHAKYGASCVTWWMHLQPLWRANDGDLPHAIYTCDEGDWGGLIKSGKNGLFLVLLSMAWWARGTKRVPPMWVTLVVDITRALESMAMVASTRQQTGTSKASASNLKRPAEDGSTRSSKR